MSHRIISGYTRKELLTMRNALQMYMLAIDEMGTMGPLVSMRLGDQTPRAAGDNSLRSVRAEAESIVRDVLLALAAEAKE
jgi:hypothetical protein